MTDMDMDTDHHSTAQGVAERWKGIMVLLVGAPGSGKSTFSDEVVRLSTRPWLRVCQDNIGNGKAGTRAQCLKSAASALQDGKSVLIDRCNLDREQRSEFVKLGGTSKADVHAVVLDLPARLCISRSVSRTGHEGNLQGGKAAAVVNRMLQNKEWPKLAEGFSRIDFCYSESDVQAVLHTYSALGPAESLPQGVFGEKKNDSKVQVGIMKFFKKAEPSVRDSKEKDSLSTNPISLTDNPVKESKEFNGSPTLAFPSISTSDFQFDPERASDIIVEKVEEYLKEIGIGRLVMVDLSHRSKILSLIRAKASRKNIDSDKFFTFVGDITQLRSKGGLHCSVIANAANWRLKPGGGGVNAAIFGAAGPSFEAATKEQAITLQPGKAVVVPLPSYSPLLSREGVTHVIHVLGPNMNPQRPNCLDNNYATGCKILRDAYTSLFEGFALIVRKSSENPTTNESKPSEVQDICNPTVKRDGAHEADRVKKMKSSQTDTETKCEDVNLIEKASVSAAKTWGSWAQSLYSIAKQPETHKDVVLEIVDGLVVLNDLYPKAQKHVLILTQHEGLDQLADVRKEHLQLLQTMHAVGLKWAQKFLLEDGSFPFRLGYHSVPSMRQLHLHVISQDFDSKHLKNKKHWNSFTTSFFRDSLDVIEEVGSLGKAKLEDDEKILSMELRCHRCRSAHPNIPRLKSHIASCRAPFPENLLENDRLLSVGI